MSIFLLYGQRFPSYEPIFKITIFGHETWQMAKVPEVPHMLSFYPKGAETELIFTLRAAVSKIRGHFSKMPYLGMKLGK